MKSAVSKIHIIAAGVIAGAFTLGFVSGPAFAEKAKAATAFGFEFSYDKAELASSDSAAKLVSRLETKVRKFCTNAARTGTRLKKTDPECLTNTMEQTIAGMNSSVVAEAYKNRARADG